MLGFQSVAQVSTTYGPGDAHTLVENCGNSLVLRSSASEGGGTARFASSLIGDREVLRTTQSRSRRPLDFIGVRTASQQVVVEAAVLPSQIEQLPDLSGDLKVASRAEWLRVQLRPEREAQVQPAGPRARVNRTGVMRTIMNGEPSEAAAPARVVQILETINAQQSQIHGMLALIDTRARELDTAVGEAVQRAFADAAGLHAGRRFAQLQRTTGLRLALWSIGVVAACALLPTVLTWMLMPSRAQITQARQTLAQLSAAVAQLSREGGRIDLRHCGTDERLCVRVDRRAPPYGENADYMVLKGY